VSYAELHCKTNFSFLEGASHASELVERAAELSYAALAITDRNSLAGVVRAHGAAKDCGLKLIIGAELHVTDAAPLVVWATDRRSYARLSRLLTVGRRRAEKGECQLSLADVAEYHEGLIAGVLPGTDDSMAAYRDLFGDRCYLLAEAFRGVDDAALLAERLATSKKYRVPLVAAGDVHYHSASRKALHDALTCIRHGVTLAGAEGILFPNAQRHLKPIPDIAYAFSVMPEAVWRTREIADRCTFSLDELRYEYPTELAPEGYTPFSYLKHLSWQGAAQRYPSGIPEKVQKLLHHELQIIEDLRYEAFFLTVFDAVRFARARGILCQGRGSAANSVVCYCLGITSVNPEQGGMLFERFISRERNEAPDIDVDFEHERREEVLQYLYQKYGRERAGLAATVITYRSRSAVRDVGKVLGLSLDRVDALAKQVEGYTQEPKLAQRMEAVGIDPGSDVGRKLIYLVNELIGFPRHLSQHVGGMVMTQGPLCELVPIENAAMPERTVIQWDKDDLDELGILKVDCLCLGMLTAIRKGFDLIERHYGETLTLATVPQEDPRVYDMICKADTLGVFQIESRAQMSMLPRLKPRTYYDLVIEVAIVRPGPIQGQMVHPYLRRRGGEPVPEYPTDEIRQVLERTLGVPLFQEQAMKLAIVAAGFTPGEADHLRRAMAAWRRPGIIDQFRVKLFDGMLQRGLSREFAELVYQQIHGFGSYGFPESHAASFALLVYVSSWLKCFYQEAFTTALLNSQPMGFYSPSSLVRDAREHGVPVLPTCVNKSDWDCTLEGEGRPLSIRLGFRLLKGFSEQHAERIIAARQGQPYHSIAEFARRTGLSQVIIGKLAEADAFASLARDRRQAVWDAMGHDRKPVGGSLFSAVEDDEPVPPLPPITFKEQLFEDYRTSGLSLKGHPIAPYREALNQLRVLPASALSTAPTNRQVRVAGLVILRQRPSTANGITFVTLEDETGAVNLVVRQSVWERFYTIARTSSAWLAHGKLERRELVIHVVVNRLQDLSAEIGTCNVTSRDFR
jgi:error-prone DNA polymerase